ncbi:MAG: glycosyltransferase family 2 protein [Candidatus Competibacteraceae bacterium]|nr:MAG: glycosyltransferase family 2 protein [Candidatus Competibacteraceae bacterium]
MIAARSSVIDNASKPPLRLNPTVADFARIVVCPTPGAYAARNAGIAAARGEVLAFTDADRIPDRNWIRAGVAALAGAEPARLEVWGERVLEAATLEAVFAEG